MVALSLLASTLDGLLAVCRATGRRDDADDADGGYRDRLEAVRLRSRRQRPGGDLISDPRSGAHCRHVNRETSGWLARRPDAA
jgi:hypothetical protein